MEPRRCRILRLTEQNSLFSADVFEQNFATTCSAWADIYYEHPLEWLNKIGGMNEGGSGTPLKTAEETFTKCVGGYDYISPGYNGFHLLPLLALLRTNRGPKLLFIAHAPVQHAVELSLAKDLLRPGDIIICPSLNARQILCTFHAGFARYTVVIPHATEPLPCTRSAADSAVSPKKLVSLGRITEDKLIHRQIDAMAILRQQGVDDVVMEIAGPVFDNRGKTIPYINELKARIHRLGLEHQVAFKGTLHTPMERGSFIAEAAVCINLSRAEEESFGKSCAEAVALGVPVLATCWNGLPETVGKCGTILPLSQLEGRQIFDIDPADCAREILKLLHQPPSPADFSSQQQLFAAGGSSAAYEKALAHPPSLDDEAPEKNAAVDFFSLIPAIRAFCPSERQDMYLAALGIRSENITSPTAYSVAAQRWERLADLIFHSIRARGKQLLAHRFDYTPASPLLDCLQKKIPVGPELVDEQMDSILLADCLRQCDSWARELTLTRLTAGSPSLGAWTLEILKNKPSATGFLLMAEVNRLLAGGDAAGAAYYLQQRLGERILLENDAPLMLYFLEICRHAGREHLLADVLENWLRRYPDAPQCSALWPVLAKNLILHKEHLHLGKEILARVEALIPDFDTSNLHSALIAMESV